MRKDQASTAVLTRRSADYKSDATALYAIAHASKFVQGTSDKGIPFRASALPIGHRPIWWTGLDSNQDTEVSLVYRHCTNLKASARIRRTGYITALS